jgi:type I restriction enzyme S subunit
MELRSGYKQTEVGPIPNEWNAASLSTVVLRHNSGVYKKSEFYGRGSNIAGVSDIYGVESINGQNFAEVPLSSAERAKYTLEANDLLYSESSLVREGIARTVHVTERGAGTAFAWHTRRYSINQKKIHSVYCYYYLQCHHARKHMMDHAIQTAITGINTVAYFACPILLPPLPEQRAIAEALSDVDALLAALDRLIAKKHDLKQAAMQQLLTGQTRLPGFSGEWDVKRFGALLRFQVGFPFSSAYFNDKEIGIRLVKNRDLKSEDQIFHYEGNYDDIFIVSNNDILIGMDGDFIPCRWNKGTALLNQRVGRIIPYSGLDIDFAFYILFESLKDIQNITSSTTVKHLSHGDIDAIERPMPPVGEQTAIAALLSDMDAELEALEQRRAKTAALKQGMMQELLTGRTRLV